MLQVELRGKLPSSTEGLEDILTSNVFSLFKYSNRQIFLRSYLESMLGLKISAQEARDAAFRFWPCFEDGTEPDLIITVGNYYLVFEAKYFSGFGKGDTNREPQLVREIRGGLQEAEDIDRDFYLIALTADNTCREEKFKGIPVSLSAFVKWTNWQSIAALLSETLETNTTIARQEREFAADLCALLDKKNLRGFRGFCVLRRCRATEPNEDVLFYDFRAAEFRGEFIGFVPSLSILRPTEPRRKKLFYEKQKKYFSPLLRLRNLDANLSIIVNSYHAGGHLWQKKTR
jgi:hypothetical protein